MPLPRVRLSVDFDDAFQAPKGRPGPARYSDSGYSFGCGAVVVGADACSRREQQEKVCQPSPMQIAANVGALLPIHGKHDGDVASPPGGPGYAVEHPGTAADSGDGAGAGAPWRYAGNDV